LKEGGTHHLRYLLRPDELARLSGADASDGRRSFDAPRFIALDQLSGEEDPIVYDVWQNPGELTMGSFRKIQEHLCILPSSPENALLDASLINPSSQKNQEALL
jgi:hypothetical protein